MLQKTARVALLGSVVSACALGCATQSDLQIVRQESREARTQAADAKSLVEGMKVDLDSVRGQFEQLKFQSESGGKLQEMMRRLDALDQRVAALEQSRAAAVPGMLGGDPGAPGAGGQAPAEVETVPASAPAEYKQGMEALRNADYQGAIQKLREFLRKSPKSELADNAQYWIGEAFYAQRDFNRAILEFNEVLLRYPKGDKVPAALLRQAFAFAELGDNVDARLVLQKLTSEHPDAPEAERGRQKLAELSQ